MCRLTRHSKSILLFVIYANVWDPLSECVQCYRDTFTDTRKLSCPVPWSYERNFLFWGTRGTAIKSHSNDAVIRLHSIFVFCQVSAINSWGELGIGFHGYRRNMNERVVWAVKLDEKIKRSSRTPRCCSLRHCRSWRSYSGPMLEVCLVCQKCVQICDYMRVV